MSGSCLKEVEDYKKYSLRAWHRFFAIVLVLMAVVTAVCVTIIKPANQSAAIGRFSLSKQGFEGTVVHFGKQGTAGSTLQVTNFEPKELWPQVDWSHATVGNETFAVVTWPRSNQPVSFLITFDTRPSPGSAGVIKTVVVKIEPSIVLFE